MLFQNSEAYGKFFGFDVCQTCACSLKDVLLFNLYYCFEQVFNTLRTTMFILGMMSVFLGITLLAPDEAKGSDFCLTKV